MPIAYLATRYPAVSHSFIQREVLALRLLGTDVRTVSVWRAPDDQVLSETDREERGRTFSVLPISPARLLAIHVKALLRRPARYVSTLWRSQTLSAPGARARLWRLFYFAEAMVVADHCRRAGIRHLHALFSDAAPDVALLVSHYGGAGWSWSMAIHGPVEFYNVEQSRLREKIREARFVQAISWFGRSQLLALAEANDWQKIHVVRCGVDPTKYAPGRAGGTSDAEFRVLCVGRLVHLKAQALLVRAIASLAEEGSRARAVLIGEGPERDRLAALARDLGVGDRVELLGAVGQDEVPDHFRAADVFCLPSLAEGIPVVLMEAMATELPVVTTRITGIPELVEDGVSGILVRPGVVEDLVEALARLEADPTGREEMGRRGRAHVVGEFNVDASAERLKALFAEVA